MMGAGVDSSISSGRVSSRILHVGCGAELLPSWLSSLSETRLDIDPAAKPDIVASMTDMGDIGEFEMVYSSHCLEHLYPHEVGVALGEFLRVLVPGGIAVAIVPDLEDARPTDDVLMVTDSGPVAGIDLFYGLRSTLKQNSYMAHHTGFVSATLEDAFEKAGFGKVMTTRLRDWNLMVRGVKP